MATSAAATIAECDDALRLLRRLRREGPLEERALAQLAIDEVLERRFALMAASEDGAVRGPVG